MREIKFRILLNEKWWYWGFLRLPSGKFCFAGIPNNHKNPLPVEELRNKSQQFIGLLDHDGKEIYEGDIVKVTNLKCQLQKAILVGRVIFDLASFGLEILYVEQWEKYNIKPPEKLDRLWFLNISGSKDIKVIGNIYENPELLMRNHL